MSNRELLAVKVALEEWRHRLEGASQPFKDGRITKTLSISKKLNDSTLARPGGHFF